MRTVYREKKYTCGEYLDVYIYPVFETGKLGGGKRTKRKPSTKAQEKLNQKHRKEKLTRMLHANFTPEDLELHGTYEVQPENDEEALRDRANYIRSEEVRQKAQPGGSEVHRRHRAGEARGPLPPSLHHPR